MLQVHFIFVVLTSLIVTSFHWNRAIRPHSHIILQSGQVTAVIDADVVRKVAKLAQFEISEDEIEVLLPRIQEFMNFVEVIKGVDLDTTPSISVAGNVESSLRRDNLFEFEYTDSIIANFPKEEDGYLYVPKVAADEP